MAEGGDQWTPSSERRQTRSATGPSHRDKVDRVWITNRVYIVEKKGNQPKYFEFHGDICLIQFLFKHHKDHLTKPNGWEYKNHNGVPCIYISYDNSVEKCIDNVKEWISKFQDVEVKKLELSSGNTEDSLQRSLSYLTPECIDGKADVFLDEVHDCLYIVGFHQTINDIFRKTKGAIKNEEMMKKTEEIIIYLDSKSYGLLLREFGFLDKLRRDFPDASICLLDCNTKVIYTGAQNEAEKCRKAIAQFFSRICTATLRMSPVKTELLSNPRVKTYVNEALQANKIPCVWEVVSPGQLQLRCPQKKYLEEAHVKIEENIKEEVFSVRDYPQLRETPSKRFGLNESQLEKVFVRHTSENTHVAATTDVMDHIMRWMQSIYPAVSDSKAFSVEKTCPVIKIKIKKPEDEEKEKMSFCPKGNCHVLYFLCKHELAKIAGEQGWKFILEEKDRKLVAKLLVKNETAIEECRDKLRKFITKVLPDLHQVNFDLSPLSSTTHSNSGNEASNQGSDYDNREHSDKVRSNRNHDNNDPLQKSLACLLPLVAGVQNRAHLLYIKDSNCLVITGKTETVKQLYMKAKAKLYIITMKTGFRSTLQGHLVRTFGIIDRLKGQYPDVGAVLEDCNTKLSWTGTEENITICRQEMEKLIGEIKTLNFPVSAMLQKLLSVPEIKSLIDTLLLKEGIICVWQVNEARDVQVWSVKSSSAKLFELKIRENFKEQSFSVKDFPFVLEVSSSGFGLSAEEMKHVVVEETNDAVNVAAMSNTMQKIIQHLQTMEDPHSAGNSGSKEGDNPAGIQKNSCTIEVRGMSQHTSDDTVELYFESRRAAGQPVDIEKFNASKREKDGVIFITYETAEVVKLVLDRQHVLDKCPLTVQLVQESESAPSKFYQEKIFFRNMNTATTQNSLESFLRSKVQETPSEFSYGKEDGTVLVSFNGCPDFEKLKHACQQSPLDESLLEAEQVPISHCVSVYGAQEKTTCDTLECYFENRRRSGGGDVSEVKEISTGTFVITFENSSVVDRVCQRSHVVDGSTLAVQVFYQVLGFRHSYARPPLKVPSSLVVTDPNQLQCIKTSGSAELEKQLGEQYVKLNWPEDGSGHLKLECLITEGVTDSHRLVLTWEDVVKDILNKFLAQAEVTKAQVALPKQQTVPVISQKSRKVSSRKVCRQDGDESLGDQGNPAEYPSRSRQLPTPSGQTFEIGNNLTVHVVHGNVVDIKADAIVSPENIQCDSTGRIAREIARVAGNDYVEIDRFEITLPCRKPKLTEVLDTLAGRSQFIYVLHVVAPEWDAVAFADQATYWTNLEKSYNNVFSLVDRKRLDVTSIALPILGTGTVADHPSPINSISRLIARICKDYAEKTPTKKTFYICNDDAAVIHHLKCMFEKTLSKRNETKDDRRSQEETQRCQDQGSKVTEDCCICMDTITDPKTLSCGHVFCRDCIVQQFKYKPACPQCGTVHGKITGDQPPGTIDIKTTKPSYGRYGSLPGYPGYGIISITYTFPSGKQGPEHPTPGTNYEGISRTAYLPDNAKGRLVAKLLSVAFNRKLIFTIGRSRTTGYDGVVTWNDIVHKTRVDGGPQAFGYPDDTYLDRVLDELKAKGVTEESLKDP